MKKLNKKGVFGLTSVQAFFSIILAIALLAYVIVVIMGTLSESSILDLATGSVTNQTVTPTALGKGYILSTVDGCTATVTSVWNATDSFPITSPNYTVSGCTVSNLTNTYPGAWNFTYSYTYNSIAQSNLNSILGNTSTGVTGFFESVNPVWAILAILVIILVLVVLVRVVQTPGARESSPQL